LGSPRALPPIETASGVVARASLLAISYAVVAYGATRLSVGYDYEVPLWPASGLALAGCLLLPARAAVPAIFLASCVALLAYGFPLAVTLAISAGAVLASWLPALVLLRIPGFSPALVRARDVALFALVGAVAGPVLSTCIGVAAVTGAGLVPAAQAPGLAFTWWAAFAIGVIVFAPAVLAFARPTGAPAPAGGRLECLALAACVALACVTPFATGLANDAALVFYAAALVPPLLWAALRHDRRALVLVNMGLAAMSVVLLLGTRTAVGPIHFREHAAMLQVLVGVVTSMGLVVSAALTEWRSAEAERRQSAERFRAAADGGFDAFGILRAVRGPTGAVDDFEVVEVNERAREILLRIHPSPEGRRMTELLPTIKNGQFFPRIVECFEHHTAREDEYRASGMVLPIDFPIECLRIVIVPLSDGVAITLRDISESKRLEAQLAQAVKLEAIGRLAGGVAHDFNNLLTAISGYGEVALAQLAPDSPVRADLEEILRAGDRAAALTRQLLAFSRRQALNRQAIDVNDVVLETTAMLGRVLGADVRLLTELAAAVPPVLADPSQIQQLVMNLALNARDALPGGGEVAVRTRVVVLDEEDARRRVGVRAGRFVALEVHDDGVGMDAATRARVFEPFFTTKPPGKGTGLGLAIVYGIVQQSNGHIAVDSAPGQGARFEVLLPAHDGARDEAAPAAALPRTTAGRGRTILLAEDEEPLRKLIERVLGSAGYRMLVGRDGAEALELAQRHAGEYDLLVTDVVMPRLGGRALAAQLRIVHPGLPVLFVSGFDAEGARASAADPSPSDFLAKPFTPEALLTRVRDLLARAGAHAAADRA